MTLSRERSPTTAKVRSLARATLHVFTSYTLPDIREFTPESWRNAIGVVPQDPVLFTGTVATNIAYGMPDAPREDIEAAARAANCEFILGLPHGFDTPSASVDVSGADIGLT